MADTDSPVEEMAEAVALKEPVRQAETPPSPPPPEMKPAPKRSGLTGGILGGLIAAGLGFALAQVVPGGWPIKDTSALEAQLATQSAELSALKAQIASLPAPDAGLATRVAALEAAPADLSSLADRIAALETRLSAIESLPADGSATSVATAEALRSLQAEVEALKASGGSGQGAQLASEAEARLKEAEAQAAALKAQAEDLAKAATARAALGRLQAALDSGAPFGAALGDLGAVPEVLKASAEQGLPTLASLQASFPEAARAALDAALRNDMGESWTDRVGSFLRTQTGARSLTPREGTDPDAILSRAEAAVAGGDLAAALTEISALPEVAQTALAEWRGLAEQRLAGAAAIAALAASIGQ